MRRAAIVLLAAMCTIAPAARAQDPRLAGRLDGETALAVTQIVDSARAARLPTEPLVAKALEGASKGAPGERIVAAVRAYAGALRTARNALSGSAEAEIIAGAGALLSGVKAEALARLRSVRRGHSLTLPLVVMADLVARGVPADTAASAIHLAARAGVRDADLLSLRQTVEQDILAGAAPAAAVALRVRSLPGAETLDMLDTRRPTAAPEDSLSRSPP